MLSISNRVLHEKAKKVPSVKPPNNLADVSRSTRSAYARREKIKNRGWNGWYAKKAKKWWKGEYRMVLEITYHRNSLRSSVSIRLPCRLNFTSPSMRSRPSTVLILFPSALSSLRCRKHSSSTFNPHPNALAYAQNPIRRNVRRRDSTSLWLISRFSRFSR